MSKKEEAKRVIDQLNDLTYNLAKEQGLDVNNMDNVQKEAFTRIVISRGNRIIDKINDDVLKEILLDESPRGQFVNKQWNARIRDRIKEPPKLIDSLNQIVTDLKNENFPDRAGSWAKEFEERGKIVIEQCNDIDQLQAFKESSGTMRDLLAYSASKRIEAIKIEKALLAQQEKPLQKLLDMLRGLFNKKGVLKDDLLALADEVQTTAENLDEVLRDEGDPELNKLADQILQTAEDLDDWIKDDPKVEKESKNIFTIIKNKISKICQKVYSESLYKMTEKEVFKVGAGEKFDAKMEKIINKTRNVKFLKAAKERFEQQGATTGDKFDEVKGLIEQRINRLKPPASITQHADKARESMASFQEEEQQEAERDSDVTPD